MRVLQANTETTIYIGRTWTLYPGETIHIDDEHKWPNVVLPLRLPNLIFVKSIHYKINGVDYELVVNKAVNPDRLYLKSFTDVTIQYNRDRVLNSLF